MEAAVWSRCPRHVGGALASRTVVFWMVAVLAVAVLAGCAAGTRKAAAVGEWPAPVSKSEIEAYEAKVAADVATYTPADQVHLARAYGSIGDWDMVVRHATLAAEADPGNAEAFAVLAGAFANKELWPRALAAAQHAVELDPHNAEAQYLEGWAYMSMDQWGPARSALETAIALEPTRLVAYHDLATVTMRVGDYPAAMKALDTGLDIDPSNKELGKMRQQAQAAIDDILAPLKAATVRSPSDWRTFAALGDRAASFGSYDVALKAYSEAARLGVRADSPQLSARLIYNVGVVYRNLNRYNDALVSLQRALLLNPEDPLIYYNIGLVYTALGDDNAAIGALEKAVEYERASIVPFVALADAYLRVGKVGAALNQYNIVKEADPNAAEALLQRIMKAQAEQGRHSVVR